MKKVRFLNLLVIALVATFTMVSCGDDGETAEDTDNVSEGGKTLTGTYSESITLEANETYYVSGETIFSDGTTLTINEGVTIIADPDVISYILIAQGATIDAEGTSSNPIIMTCSTETAGSWGGLHICGKAQINAEGGTGSSEIGDQTYGGSTDTDNSGTIKYVILKYTGVALDSEHESNGISFYGVGSGTTVEYVQVYEGADDGYEFFGGAVNLKYAISSGSQDDSFDWTEGWRGKGQYWLAIQNSGDGDRGIEADNNGDDNEATPYANPTLSQISLFGGHAGTTDGNYGMKLREGTKGYIANVIVTGFDKRDIHVEHNQTISNVNAETLTVDYAVLASDISDKTIKYSVSKIDSTDADGNVVTDSNGDAIEINDPDAPELDDTKKFEARGTINTDYDMSTIGTDVSKTYTGGVDMSSEDSFFESDTQIGSGSDWATSWAILD